MELDGFVMPRAKIQSKIMQAATRFQHRIPKAWFPTPQGVFHHAITFDAPNRMLDAYPYRRKPLINMLVHVRQGFAFGGLFRLKDDHLVEGKPLKTGVLD